MGERGRQNNPPAACLQVVDRTNEVALNESKRLPLASPSCASHCGPVGYGEGGEKSNKTSDIDAGPIIREGPLENLSWALRATSEELTASYDPRRGFKAGDVRPDNCNILKKFASLEVIDLALSATRFQGVCRNVTFGLLVQTNVWIARLGGSCCSLLEIWPLRSLRVDLGRASPRNHSGSDIVRWRTSQLLADGIILHVNARDAE